MIKSLRSRLPFLILLVAMTAFGVYFSLFTILRYQKLYAHYFDLGIMHQTVFNTYKALQTGDMSRVLEMTDPHMTLDQVKRMSVHNDIFLALLSPAFFIYSGPETLLVIQAIGVALGAFFVYRITQIVFEKSRKRDWMAVVFALSYLLYPPLQKAVNFDFHAVTLSTPLLLGMYYFWLEKKYIRSSLFLVLTLLTKEQVGLVIALFGVYVLIKKVIDMDFGFLKAKNPLHQIRKLIKAADRREVIFSTFAITSGIVWVLLSMLVIIPAFRGTEHFGAQYYEYLKDDPLRVFPVVFRYETFHYLFILTAPLGMLALFSPVHLLMAASEFATNILSSNGNMRNIYFHYDTALTAFVMIASIYGAKTCLNISSSRTVLKKFPVSSETIIILYVLSSTVLFSLYLSPLPWGHHRDLYAWTTHPGRVQDVRLWQKYLSGDDIKVSATGHIAPYFTSRRYFYDFAGGYEKAEYVIVDVSDIGRGFQAEESTANYEALQNDWRYITIYEKNDIKVYKNISQL